jgi:hypothetical protein
MSSNLDVVFTKRMADLQSAVGDAGAAMQLFAAPMWFPLYTDKPGNDGKVLNGFDHAEFVQAFNRTALNKAYVDSVNEPASYRDLQVSKVQIDLLAATERDLRMRYRSRVRMLAHGIARMQSHGLSIGPINRGAVNFVKLLMERR